MIELVCAGNENSYPDIALLAPIARLLNISLDTLFSFQDELTQAEINAIVMEAYQMFKTLEYADCFDWIKSKIEAYPNCLNLISQLTAILDAQRLLKEVPNVSSYDRYILECYNRVLQSKDEGLRTQAAEALFSYYLRNEQYEKAESYLSYYSIQNPQRKLKQSIIYHKTGRMNEAYKTSEELLFSEYQLLSIALHNLYLLAMDEKDFKKAHLLTDKQQEMVKLFDMGKYNEVVCKLELATVEKDVDTLLDIMETMLASVETLTDFSKSELYSHMDFKNASSDFIVDMKEEILRCFRDEETYGFLADHERWKKLVQVQ